MGLYGDLLELNKEPITPPQTEEPATPSPTERAPEKTTPKKKRSPSKRDTVTPRHRDTTQPRNRGITTPRHHATMQPRYQGSTVEAIRAAVKLFGKEAATYRFTAAEKKALADLVYTYKRQGIRTSENEISRVGINFMMADYEENGENSILHKVLTALNQ